MTEEVAIEVFGSEPVQAVGTVGGREFYFRSRHDEWTAEVGNAVGGLPSDGFSGGFYRHGFDKNASYLSRSRVDYLVERSIEEYFAIRKQLPAAYTDLGLSSSDRVTMDVNDVIRVLLALRGPIVTRGLVDAVGGPRRIVDSALAALREQDEVRFRVRGRGKYWLLPETYTWLTFE